MPDRKFAQESNAAPREPALQTRNDSVLQSRIAERLHAFEVVDTGNVSVLVRNRSATLFGSVESELQRVLIQELALSISGVLEVNNRLKLIPTAH